MSEVLAASILPYSGLIELVLGFFPEPGCFDEASRHFLYSSKYRKNGLEIFLIRSVFTLLKTETIRHRGLVVLLCTILLGRSSSTLNKFVYAAFCTCQSGDRSLSQLLHTGGGDSAVCDPMICVGLFVGGGLHIPVTTVSDNSVTNSPSASG